jgi:polyisoprenoid-binding protein YceI
MSTTTQVQIPTGPWSIDPVHSSIGFRVRHMGVSWFRGEFKDVQGTVTTADGELTGVAGTISIPSLAVDNQQLHGHLLGPDFFDAEQHGQGRFVSTHIERVDESHFRVTGQLTLRGQPREVTLDATLEGVGDDITGVPRLGLTATGEIERSRFGINWNAPLDNGGSVVGDTVRLSLDIEAKLEQA